MSDRDLAIIVPVHNELGNIVPFYDRTCAVLDSLSAISLQMVFVNDGSDDGSLERICELRAKDKRVKVISLSRDFGYHAVLLAGLSLITADRYAMIDVDCEDPPELLREFHSALEGGADVAYGIRSNRVEPMVVTFFRRLFYYLNKGIADSDIVLWMAEFAMISRQVRDAIVAPHTTYVFLRAELGYVGFVRVGVPYVRGVRTSGKSHYNFFNMTRFAAAGFLASARTSPSAPSGIARRVATTVVSTSERRSCIRASTFTSSDCSKPSRSSVLWTQPNGSCSNDRKSMRVTRNPDVASARSTASGEK